MKIFIIESPSPNDVLDSRNERNSLENVCRMFGHKAASFTTYSKKDFRIIVKYISEINIGNNDFFCLHLSCHGNDEGIAIGPDFIKWEELSTFLIPMLTKINLKDKWIIILSACGANEQKVTKSITNLSDNKKDDISPAKYFFVYNELEVPWNDALLSWTILYHQLSKITRLDREDIQNILTRIKYSELGNIIYFRWDNNRKKYKRFRPQNRRISQCA